MEKPVTLIIGVGQTVGDAIARRFIENQHNVVVVDPDAEVLGDLQKTVGDKVTIHVGAIHSTLGLRNALASTVVQHQTVDNVICVPALPGPDNLLEMSMEAFDAALQASVKAAVLALRVFVPHMIDRKEDEAYSNDRQSQAGSFTFVLSLAAKMGQVQQFSESVLQHAVLGVVKAASLELAPHKVRVNAIIALRPRAETREPWLKQRTPAGRAAAAEEIAEAAVFLTNPASAIITGESIVLDGARRHLSGMMPDQNES